MHIPTRGRTRQLCTQAYIQASAHVYAHAYTHAYTHADTRIYARARAHVFLKVAARMLATAPQAFDSLLLAGLLQDPCRGSCAATVDPPVQALQSPCAVTPVQSMQSPCAVIVQPLCSDFAAKAQSVCGPRAP